MEFAYSSYSVEGQSADSAVPKAATSPGDGSGPTPFPIVGIGASAGGLEALGSFFDHLPLSTGMAFVVVQHLSPDFKSLMDELLARHTKVAIHRVEDKMLVQPDAIYLMPPRKEMIISGGRLLLTDKDPEKGLALPIDTFFRSLAQDAGPQAVGIILSGTGSDGSRGVRSIHEVGGLVIAQSESTAKFDGMPRAAIETGTVDFVLPPEEMPSVLIRYAAHPAADRSLRVADMTPGVGVGVELIIGLLRDEYGIDFSHYKPTTVMRRIERRLQLNQSLDLEQYIERLKRDSGELNSLYKDLLIGVTKFFRDREAFERLERDVLPNLLLRVPGDAEFRVWVAGCATGEEAYSLAMLIHERCQILKRRVNVKIFATDVHRASLEYASAGIYTEVSLSEVAPERLEKYFQRHGSMYHVSPELRKMIVFAPHNLIKDAPFTKLDLITCRNLLIYFQSHAQKKALSLFHFGLRTGGVLFLGPSESPGEIGDEFESIDDHWKIYRKRRDVRLSDMRLPLTMSGFAPKSSTLLTPPQPAGMPELQLLRAYDALLEDFMPPSLLLNERRELVHTFGGAGKYLSPRDGRPSLDVLDLVHKDLKLALTGGLQRAARDFKPVAYSRVRVQTSEGEHHVKLTVKPLPGRNGDGNYSLITFEDMAKPLPVAPGAEVLDVNGATHEHMHSLEAELRHTKENLQATIEEMETSNEELQATNEELIASNEELQSTNEELHSVNEELYTVNAEYQRKIVELTEMTDDMDNMLRGTEVGTIFLDRDLRIRKFTPQMTHLFQILPQDIGRRIDSFAHNIDDRAVLDDVSRVLADRVRMEREVRARNGGWFLMRILPYQTKGRIEGVLLTLVDISILKQTARELRLMSKVFRDSADAIIIEDLSGKIIDLNAETERAYGWSREELLGQSIEVVTPEQELVHLRTLQESCRHADHVRNVECVRRTKSGQHLPVLMTMSLLTDDTGEPVAIASLAKDLSVRKRAEQQLEAYTNQLQLANQSLQENMTRREQAEAEAHEAIRRRDQFLAMLSHELRNPLAAVLNATYVMDGQSLAEGACKEALEIIQRQSRQMARLLDDLLDVSRVMQSKIEVRKESVDLVELASEAVRTVRSMVDSRQQTIHLELPSQPVWVHGDPARLMQVLENLLTNSSKYTPCGGHVSLAVAVDGGDAKIAVRDNGEGIPSCMLERIFELFVQSDETLDRSSGGMGVGLTLVRSLVSLHGGTVSARSEGVGQGSEFIVRLPLTSYSPPAASAGKQEHLELELKVVLVEDNADSRYVLKTLLERAGCDVAAAGDGPSGLQMVLDLKPDLAIIDIGLPGMDGYEIGRQIRSKLGKDDIYLVALTGYGRSEDREQVLSAGFDQHWVKPVDRANLLHRLSDIRDRMRARFAAPPAS